MSFLHTPRLTFSGDFEANVSTVNNDVRYYNNETFLPRFQNKSEDINDLENGLWNPDGGSTFKLLNCTVKQVTYDNNLSINNKSNDSIIGQLIAGAEDKSCGKIVDIDPQYQLCSELWGISVRIYTSKNELILKGKLLNCSLRDFHLRLYNESIKIDVAGIVGVNYGSVLTDLEWGETKNESKFIQELKERTDDNCVSINLSVYGYSSDFKHNRFLLGYVVGVIGPHFSSEPNLFAPVRRLNGYSVGLEYSDFLFEKNKNRVTINFGNSFPLFDPEGMPLDIGSLFIAASKNNVITKTTGLGDTVIKKTESIVIGEVHYQVNDWLKNTSGIVFFNISDTISNLLVNHQLLILSPNTTDDDLVIAAEHQSGLTIRADEFTQRLDPGETVEIDVYAVKWGKALANTEIKFTLAAPFRDDNVPESGLSVDPFTGIPADALSFQNALITNNEGKVTLVIDGYDPKNPRGFIDGQLYLINYNVAGLPSKERSSFDVIVIQLRNKYDIPAVPGWNDIKSTFTQYANLYPIMSKHIVDLSNREEVLKYKKILLHSFTRDISDPNYMPVTRDLSSSKRKIIIKWLENMIKDESTDLDIAPLTSENKKILRPTEKDFSRSPAIIMKRSQYEGMIRENKGKGPALRKIRNAINIIDD